MPIGFMKLILVSIAVLFFASCATVHDGQSTTAKVDRSDEAGAHAGSKISSKVSNLIISSKMEKTFSRNGFHFIEVTLQSTSKEWIEVGDIQFLSHSADFNKKADVIGGNKIAAYLEGVRNEISIEAYNRSLWMSGIALAGAAAASSNNSNVSTAGVLAASTALTLSTVDSYRGAVNRVENKASVNALRNFRLGLPANHLLKGGTIIAPGFFIRRFIIIDGNQAPRIPYENGFKLTAKVDGVPITATLYPNSGCKRDYDDYLGMKKTARKGSRKLKKAKQMYQLSCGIIKR